MSFSAENKKNTTIASEVLRARLQNLDGLGFETLRYDVPVGSLRVELGHALCDIYSRTVGIEGQELHDYFAEQVYQKAPAAESFVHQWTRGNVRATIDQTHGGIINGTGLTIERLLANASTYFPFVWSNMMIVDYNLGGESSMATRKLFFFRVLEERGISMESPIGRNLAACFVLTEFRRLALKPYFGALKVCNSGAIIPKEYIKRNLNHLVHLSQPFEIASLQMYPFVRDGGKEAFGDRKIAQIWETLAFGDRTTADNRKLVGYLVSGHPEKVLSDLNESYLLGQKSGCFTVPDFVAETLELPAYRGSIQLLG